MLLKQLKLNLFENSFDSAPHLQNVKLRIIFNRDGVKNVCVGLGPQTVMTTSAPTVLEKVCFLHLHIVINVRPGGQEAGERSVES